MIRTLLALFRRVLTTRKQEHRPARRRMAPRRPGMESLETRATPAVLPDLVPAAIDLAPLFASAGTTVQVAADVDNRGNKSSGTFVVEFRLKGTGPDNGTVDQVLATVSRSSISAGRDSRWTQALTIPAKLPNGTSLPEGSYQLRIVADPLNRIKEQSEANNTAIDPTSTSILQNVLTGTVKNGSTTKQVSIRPLNPAAPLVTNVETWIVIHGRNSSPDVAYLKQLATAIDNEPAANQVLFLDWSAAAASGILGGSGENYIKPVAQWATTALVGAGFAADQLNFAGHSWGAYIASETAEVFASRGAGEIGSIIALDAATDFPGGSYNPEKAGEVNFSFNTAMSWAFYDADGDIYGSGKTALTADETITIKNSSHTKLVEVVADLIALNSLASPIAAAIDLERLLAATFSSDWTPNRYTASGAFSLTGAYEAVIFTTNSGTRVGSLQYTPV